ncbi:ferredoxin (2fe-2s) [Nannochloropsis gaditana]|uniref:Ferredoxin (2fe-2s) n=1 Tax=Nannochloropsis gaditana TaxID=72520 RepID=W7TQF0_9STRA|nr:ferredoxin (2fe-2s) [Nannochloropsis gaditana]
MHSLALTLLACFIFSIAQAFVPCVPGLRAKNAQRVGAINVVPLELEGQLDPTKTWDVKMTYKGETKVLTVSEDTCILEAAEKEWDVPCSCRNGICTTCAGRVIANPDSKKEAIHGLSAEQSKNGFVLTCQTHPCGPGLEVELGMYDTVYESQYGQYEKKATTEQKSKFNVFG